MDDKRRAFIDARHLMLDVLGMEEPWRVVVQIAEARQTIDHALRAADQVAVVEDTVAVAVHVDSNVAGRHRTARAQGGAEVVHPRVAVLAVGER